MNDTIKTIIEREIKQASAANPVSSTRLIEIVREQTGRIIDARKVRFVVAELREKSKLPVLATKREPKGYYLCQSREEFESYAVEIRAHAIRELTTIAQIKADYFNQGQPELFLL